MSEIVTHAASSDSRIGSEVAGYRIERLLGRGGMSAVYLAEDVALGRKVALKLLSAELSEDERFRQRFRLESRLAASIDHPNVIPIYEAGQAEDGTLFIAMRYVEGADLKRVLSEEGALEPKRAVGLLAQAAQGLDEAHARGLVHRDVKPSNVLIATSEAGTEHVYLADFGLTRTSTSPEDAKESITLSGSSDYVSPEQIRGSGSDNASDIYALGCVAFECLTGQVPFPRTGELQVLFAHMNDEPPAPSTRNGKLPEALDAVTAKAMAKEPVERYQSGTELVDAVREATASPRRRFSGKAVAVLVALLAVIVAAAVIPAVLLTGGADDGAASAPVTASIATVAGNGNSSSEGDGGPALEASFTPDSVGLDAAGNIYIADFTFHRIRKVDLNGVITTFAGTGDRGIAGDGGPATEAELTQPSFPVFDAEGNLYFTNKYGTPGEGIIRKVDPDGIITTVAGGGTRTPAPNESGLATEVQLSGPWLDVDTDGTLYIADQNHHRILKVETDGTYVTVAGTGTLGVSEDGGLATQTELSRPQAPAVAPDGSVYFADNSGSRLRRVDLEGVITTIAGTGERGFSGDGGPAAKAELLEVEDLVFDSHGNLYFPDSPHNASSGNRVRVIDTSGIITTIAGTGEAGFSGDGGPPTEAQLNGPLGVALGPDGSLYIADDRNNRIRKVTFG